LSTLFAVAFLTKCTRTFLQKLCVLSDALRYSKTLIRLLSVRSQHMLMITADRCTCVVITLLMGVAADAAAVAVSIIV